MARKGIYRGPLLHLYGQSAMIQFQESDKVAAQFDSTNLLRDGVNLGHNWHIFDASDFEILEEVKIDD